MFLGRLQALQAHHLKRDQKGLFAPGLPELDKSDQEHLDGKSAPHLMRRYWPLQPLVIVRVHE